MAQTNNPSLVSSEAEVIASFKEKTEKRRSNLTLNELNYISDNQLHQKAGGGSGCGGVDWDLVIKFTFDVGLNDYTDVEIVSGSFAQWYESKIHYSAKLLVYQIEVYEGIEQDIYSITCYVDPMDAYASVIDVMEQPLAYITSDGEIHLGSYPGGM